MPIISTCMFWNQLMCLHFHLKYCVYSPSQQPFTDPQSCCAQLWCREEQRFNSGDAVSVLIAFQMGLYMHEGQRNIHFKLTCDWCMMGNDWQGSVSRKKQVFHYYILMLIHQGSSCPRLKRCCRTHRRPLETHHFPMMQQMTRLNYFSCDIIYIFKCTNIMVILTNKYFI